MRERRLSRGAGTVRREFAGRPRRPGPVVARIHRRTPHVPARSLSVHRPVRTLRRPTKRKTNKPTLAPQVAAQAGPHRQTIRRLSLSSHRQTTRRLSLSSHRQTIRRLSLSSHGRTIRRLSLSSHRRKPVPSANSPFATAKPTPPRYNLHHPVITAQQTKAANTPKMKAPMMYFPAVTPSCPIPASPSPRMTWVRRAQLGSGMIPPRASE